MHIARSVCVCVPVRPCTCVLRSKTANTAFLSWVLLTVSGFENHGQNRTGYTSSNIKLAITTCVFYCCTKIFRHGVNAELTYLNKSKSTKQACVYKLLLKDQKPCFISRAYFQSAMASGKEVNLRPLTGGTCQDRSQTLHSCQFSLPVLRCTVQG